MPTEHGLDSTFAQVEQVKKPEPETEPEPEPEPEPKQDKAVPERRRRRSLEHDEAYVPRRCSG